MPKDYIGNDWPNGSEARVVLQVEDMEGPITVLHEFYFLTRGEAITAMNLLKKRAKELLND